MKTLKKLKLNKEVVADLNDNQMNQIKGGSPTFLLTLLNPGDPTCYIAQKTEGGGGDYGGGGYGGDQCNSGILEGGSCYTQDYEICRTR